MHAAPRVTRSLVAGALLAAARAPAMAAAQGASPAGTNVVVAPGSRVRVRSLGAAPRVGTLLDLGADSVAVRWAHGDSIRMPLADVDTLEVSRGLRRHTWRGVGLGLLAGAGVGFVMGYRSYDACESATDCIPWGGRGISAAAGAIVIGAAGAVVGGVIGSLLRTEAWKPVALGPQRVGLAFPSRGPRRGLGVAVAF